LLHQAFGRGDERREQGDYIKQIKTPLLRGVIAPILKGKVTRR
jgi:hypothetical protein